MTCVDKRVQLSDGAKLRVRVLGSEDTRKPLLIALHGAPGASSLVETEAAYGFLADRFGVLVYDVRGSGGSDLTEPFTDERWVTDVDELRAWAGAETFVLAGGSYGGFVALGYALQFPARLSGLVLRDTWACGPRGVLRALGEIMTSTRVRPDLHRQVRLWSGNMRGREDYEVGIAETVEIYFPERDGPEEPRAFEGASNEFELHWETHNATFSYSVPRFDVRGRLGEVEAPTLVVVGRHDVICPVEDSEELGGKIPGAELVVFEGSGHNPPTDEPEVFREVVGEFLGKLSL